MGLLASDQKHVVRCRRSVKIRGSKLEKNEWMVHLLSDRGQDDFCICLVCPESNNIIWVGGNRLRKKQEYLGCPRTTKSRIGN